MPLFKKYRIIKHLIIILLLGCGVIVGTRYFLKYYTKHNQSIVVPNLEGESFEIAEKILEEKNLHAVVIDSIYKQGATPGSIIEQSPQANGTVKEGRNIYLVLQRKQIQKVTVPDLSDYSLRQAEAMLMNMGFKNISIEKAYSKYSGIVIAIKRDSTILEANERIAIGTPLSIVVGDPLTPPDSINIIDFDDELIDNEDESFF